MENETRLIKAMTYLENATRNISYRIEQDQINNLKGNSALKNANTSIRNAITLIRNTKDNTRISNIERDIELIKELIKTRSVEK